MKQDNKSANDKKTEKMLGAIIYREISKPDGEADMELVAACEEELAALDTSATVSEKELDEKLLYITGKTQSDDGALKKKRLHMIKRISVVAACLILVIGGLTLTAYATVPSIRAMILNILKLPVGSTIEDGGITYVNGGDSTQYSSIDELIDAENLRDYGIILPDDLPREMKISKILFVNYNNSFSLEIQFIDDSISMGIEIDRPISVESTTEQIVINNFTVYLDNYNGEFSSMMEYAGNTYYITSTSRDKIITIFEHMNME